MPAPPDRTLSGKILGNGHKLTAEHFDFVSAIQANPSAEPRYVVIEGLLGRSPDEGKVRLYSTPALNIYLEIPIPGIFHSEPSARERRDSVLQGTRLYIDRNTTVRYHRMDHEADLQGEYLIGPYEGLYPDGPDQPQPAGPCNSMLTMCYALNSAFCVTKYCVV